MGRAPFWRISRRGRCIRLAAGRRAILGALGRRPVSLALRGWSVALPLWRGWRASALLSRRWPIFALRRRTLLVVGRRRPIGATRGRPVLFGRVIIAAAERDRRSDKGR